MSQNLATPPFNLPELIHQFAHNARLDAFGGVHAPGLDYADVTVAASNCVVATQDFHDYLLDLDIPSGYIEAGAGDNGHVANLLLDTVIDWTLRQFFPTAEVPTVEALAQYRQRLPNLRVASLNEVGVYAKDSVFPYWWSSERRIAFERDHPSFLADLVG